MASKFKNRIHLVRWTTLTLSELRTASKFKSRILFGRWTLILPDYLSPERVAHNRMSSDTKGVPGIDSSALDGSNTW